jgi:hypothetical protein
MGGGSKFINNWSCSMCDFEESTILAPFGVKPKPGIPRSHIEERWCDDCNGIRRCFTGKGYHFEFRDIPGNIMDFWRYKNIKDLNDAFSLLEKLRISNQQFSQTEDYNKWLDLSNKISEYKKAQKKVIELTKVSFDFYEKNISEPKCLICGSTNVSNVRWDLDHHSCGGEFTLKESDVRFYVKEYESIEYDEKGNSFKSVIQIK